MLTVRAITFADIEKEPNFPDLLSEYAAEAGNKKMPPAVMRRGVYVDMEAAHLLHIFAAKSDEVLIGFIALLASPVGHYANGSIVVGESFFVASAHRKTGAGLRLLKAAEARAKSMKASVLLITAPTESALAKVLPRCGYDETNRIFMKKIGNA